MNIDSIDTKSFIENKCYELLNLKETYNHLLKNVQESAIKLDTDPHFYVSYIDTKTSEMHIAYNNYISLQRDLSQFAHLLGDDCVEIMNGILKNGGEQNE